MPVTVLRYRSRLRPKSYNTTLLYCATVYVRVLRHFARNVRPTARPYECRTNTDERQERTAPISKELFFETTLFLALFPGCLLLPGGQYAFLVRVVRGLHGVFSADRLSWRGLMYSIRLNKHGIS